MPDYKYAIEFNIKPPDRIENSVVQLLTFCENKYGTIVCRIKDIEATGEYGLYLTEKIEKEQTWQAFLEEIIHVFQEDGQVIELNMEIFRGDFFGWVIIRDGMDFNFLTNEASILDKHKIGEFVNLDLKLFNVG